MGYCLSIKDILKNKYKDFLDFCMSSGKVYAFELTEADFAAFQVNNRCPREYVNQIRKIIDIYAPASGTANSEEAGTASAIDVCEDAVTEKVKKEKFHTSKKWLYEAALLMLRDEDYKRIELFDGEKAYLGKLMEAKEDIGRELCLEALKNTPFVAGIYETLNVIQESILQETLREENSKLIAACSERVGKKKLLPFITAYSAKERKNLYELRRIMDEDTAINDLLQLMQTLERRKDAICLLSQMNEFLDWLNFDFESTFYGICEELFVAVNRTGEKSYDIIHQRSVGKTLNEVGQDYGITRERVRQIEAKALKKFWESYHKQKYDLSMMIYALHGGDHALFFSDFEEVLGDYAPLIWDAAKSAKKDSFFVYAPEADAIVINSSRIYQSFEKC